MPEDTIRGFCRRVWSEWAAHWPEPQNWKLEVKWIGDAVHVLVQSADADHVWSIQQTFMRSELELGSRDVVKWKCLQSWKELQLAVKQQEDTSCA